MAKTISHTLDVDVFILSYKRPLFLAEAIKSVLMQTKQPKKITILDNGSGNDVKQVVEEFFRYGVLWEGAETTHSRLWNFRRAVKKANSKYVLIMHDDDRLCPDFLEKQIEFFEKNQNIIAVGCNGPTINSEGVRTGALILPNEEENKIYDSSVKVALRYTIGGCLVFASFVYRTDYIKQVRVKEEFDKVADAVLLCDLADLGPIAHQELPLYEVRVHSGQDSASGFPNHLLSLLDNFFVTRKCKDLQLVRYLQNAIRRRARRRATRQTIVEWWRNIKEDKSLVAVLKGFDLICTRNFSVMEATRFVCCEAKHMLVRKLSLIKKGLYSFSKFLDEPFKKTSNKREMLDFYSHFINKGDLCFDIGAHKGNRTEILLKLGAKVVAAEPQESCIDYLRQKFNKEPGLTLVNKGLSDKEGKLTLYISEEATTISTFSDNWKAGRFSDYKWNKSKLAPVTTLDNLIKEFGLPVFCKIDVEGFEFQVLKGLSQPIPYISFEFTREFLNDAKSCVSHLLFLGYREFNCVFGESAQMLFQTWVTPEELYQKLSSIDDESLLWGDIYAKAGI